MSRNPSSHQQSQNEIASDNPCRLNRSMQHSSILLIRLCFSKRPDLLGCTQLNLNRAVFSLNQRSRTNLAIETTADWTSGRCCVDPLRPPLLSTSIQKCQQHLPNGDREGVGELSGQSETRSAILDIADHYHDYERVRPVNDRRS